MATKSRNSDGNQAVENKDDLNLGMAQTMVGGSIKLVPFYEVSPLNMPCVTYHGVYICGTIYTISIRAATMKYNDISMYKSIEMSQVRLNSM